MQQLEIRAVVDAPAQKVTWGGRRAGAGRKKLPGGPRQVPHRVRAKHVKSRPVHVTMRARKGLPSLRAELVRKMMLEVLARQRHPKKRYAGEFHVIHFSIQSNHLHVMVEANDKTKLRSGTSGLVIAFARQLMKRLFGAKSGKVWAERYHARELGSPREVRNALVYIFQNFRKHGYSAVYGEGLVDLYSTAASFEHWAKPPRVAFAWDEPAKWLDHAEKSAVWNPDVPRTWLLERGWRDYYPPLDTSERPASRG